MADSSVFQLWQLGGQRDLVTTRCFNLHRGQNALDQNDRRNLHVGERANYDIIAQTHPPQASLDPPSIAMLSTNMPGNKLSDDSRISVTQDQVSCDLAGEAAILNLKNSVYYGLDPVGARVWNLIQEPKTLAEIRDTLLGIYDVDSLKLESDLRALLTELAEQGLIDIQT